MSRRTKAMQIIAGLAGDKAEAALHGLAQEHDSLVRGEAQLSELERFAREYREDAAGAGLSMAELVNRQRFAQRIDEAIDHQHRVLAHLRESSANQRRVWVDAQGRAKALDSVAQRLDEHDARAGERQEQFEADERAGRKRQTWE